MNHWEHQAWFGFGGRGQLQTGLRSNIVWPGRPCKGVWWWLKQGQLAQDRAGTGFQSVLCLPAVPVIQGFSTAGKSDLIQPFLIHIGCLTLCVGLWVTNIRWEIDTIRLKYARVQMSSNRCGRKHLFQYGPYGQGWSRIHFCTWPSKSEAHYFKNSV